MMRSENRGFTIIELLIAATIFLVILTALGSLFVSSNRASNTNRDLAESSAQTRSAIQAIQYDVSMAGYRGVDASAGDRSVSQPVTITVETDDDGAPSIRELTVRYFEDRYVAGGPTLTTVRYEVTSDGDLLRQVNGGDATPIATFVESLRLLNYRRTGEDVRAPGDEMPEDLTGFDFQLVYLQGKNSRSENFSVRLVNQ